MLASTQGYKIIIKVQMIKYNIGKYTDKENNPHVHIKFNCHQRVSKVGVDIMHMDRQGGSVGGLGGWGVGV